MRSIAFIAGVIISSIALAKGPDINKVNRSIHFEAGVEYGNLETVNGSITVARGARADQVSTVNGGIEIERDAVLGSVETVNGGIEIGTTVEVAADVSTVNGGIEIESGSRIQGKLETVNGAIKLEASEVGRGIQTVNGDITVGADSRVRGGILVEKPRNNNGFNWGTQRTPRVVIGANAVVEGALEFKREVELFVHETAKVGTITGATAQKFSGQRP